MLLSRFTIFATIPIGIYIIKRRLLNALFWLLETSQTSNPVKNKATVDVHFAYTLILSYLMIEIFCIYRRGLLCVARFDGMGNAKASSSETGKQ